MKSIKFVRHSLLVTILAVGYAGLASAQSQQDPRLMELADAAKCVFPEMPAIPQPAGATMEQMVATQGAIQAYIEHSNTLLECLDGIVKNEDLPAEDRQLALDAYNAEVTNQQTLAENWNTSRTHFLDMQKQ